MIVPDTERLFKQNQHRTWNFGEERGEVGVFRVCGVDRSKLTSPPQGERSGGFAFHSSYLLKDDRLSQNARLASGRMDSAISRREISSDGQESAVGDENIYRQNLERNLICLPARPNSSVAQKKGPAR